MVMDGGGGERVIQSEQICVVARPWVHDVRRTDTACCDAQTDVKACTVTAAMSGRSSHTDRDGGDKGEDERKKVKEKKGILHLLELTTGVGVPT